MWTYNSVFYQIYPIGFCGAPVHNDGVTVPRIRKIMEWSDYLKDLGVDSILLNPIFDSDNHGYDTRDYKLVDRRLGTNDDFREFTKLCHENGIKVVVDGVFNHTGREFFAFKDIQEKKWDSPYKDWYKGVNFDWQSPLGDPFGYEAWQGHFELPCLNLYNQQVKDYLFDVIRFWVDEFDIDGIRLDCANILDFNFMKEMRTKTASMKPDFWLMGEVIHGDYSRWVNPEMLHSVTNYELHKSIYSGFNDHNFFEIAHNVRRLEAIGRQLYTFLDNHDEDRIASKLKVKEHLYPVYTCLMTLPGIPSIYYGSEFGIEGKKEQGSDASLRPHLELSDYADAMTDNPLTALIAKLGSIHQAQKALCYGEYKELLLTNRQYAFARCYENEDVITAVNNDEQSTTLHIPYQGPKTQFKGALSGKDYMVQNGSIEITLDACGGDILI